MNTLLPGGQLIIIGTLIHPLAVLADLLETPNNWVKKRYTAYVDGVQEEGHELWAEARPHDWLQSRKKEIGSWAFASEFMNDPRVDASVPIKPEMIKYWKELPEQMNVCMAVDPAYSEDEKADFKVCVLVGIDLHQNRYLVDYIRTHAPQGEFIDSVINMYLRNKGQITGVGVPNVGVEKAFYESMLKQAEQRKIYPPFVGLKNVFRSASGGQVRAKKERIVACLQPLFEQGKYLIHENHFEARDELLTIGSSRWDDLVDAMAYAEQLVIPYFQEPNVP